MSEMASLITGVSIVYSTVCSGGDQRKHQSSASLASVWGIHRWPVNCPHKGPVTRKMFPFDDVIMRHTVRSQGISCRLLACRLTWLVTINHWQSRQRIKLHKHSYVSSKIDCFFSAVIWTHNIKEISVNHKHKIKLRVVLSQWYHIYIYLCIIGVYIFLYSKRLNQHQPSFPQPDQFDDQEYPIIDIIKSPRLPPFRRAANPQKVLYLRSLMHPPPLHT